MTSFDILALNLATRNMVWFVGSSVNVDARRGKFAVVL